MGFFPFITSTGKTLEKDKFCVVRENTCRGRAVEVSGPERQQADQLTVIDLVV
jgi:hypothetical protein